MDRGSGLAIAATFSAIILFLVIVGGLLSGSPSSVNGPTGVPLAPSASPSPGSTTPGASASPGSGVASPSPSPSPSVDPAAEAQRLCPTGAVGQAIAAASASPLPERDIWGQGAGDPCAYISVYLGRERLITDPLDPTTTRVEIELLTADRMRDPDGRDSAPRLLTLLAITATGANPVPPAAAEQKRLTDGGIRFGASETFIWRLLYGTRSVLVDDGACPAREVTLAIPDASIDRYVLRLRIPDEGEILELCGQPLADGTAIARLETIKFNRDAVRLPALDPVELNPLSVSLLAAQGRWYNPDLVASIAKRQAGPSGDPLCFLLFLFGFGVALALGAFAFWLLFLSGERRIKARGERKTRR